MLCSELFEAIEDWSGEWVHYSDSPFMKINLKPGHFDCAGVYFFPSNFKPVNFWSNKPYKFVATMKPSMRVLDLTKLTIEDCKEIAAKAGVLDRYEAAISEYAPESRAKATDMLWSELSSHFARGNSAGARAALFNKLFRSMGYDAVFDDIRAIHVAEVQLVVLNPRVIAHVRLEQPKRSGYAAMQKVLGEVAAIAKRYGELEIEQPKKKKDYYSHNVELTAQIEVRRSEDNYAHIALTFDEKRNTIIISLKWAKPMLRAGYGALYDIGSEEYSNYNGLREIILGLDSVFQREDA